MSQKPADGDPGGPAEGEGRGPAGRGAKLSARPASVSSGGTASVHGGLPPRVPLAPVPPGCPRRAGLIARGAIVSGSPQLGRKRAGQLLCTGAPAPRSPGCPRRAGLIAESAMVSGLPSTDGNPRGFPIRAGSRPLRLVTSRLSAPGRAARKGCDHMRPAQPGRRPAGQLSRAGALTPRAPGRLRTAGRTAWVRYQASRRAGGPLPRAQPSPDNSKKRASARDGGQKCTRGCARLSTILPGTLAIADNSKKCLARSLRGKGPRLLGASGGKEPRLVGDCEAGAVVFGVFDLVDERLGEVGPGDLRLA